MPMLTELGALKLVDRAAWAKKIKAAMRESKGRIPEAAEALGVSKESLFRWLKEDDFDDIDRSPSGLRRDRKPAKK